MNIKTRHRYQSKLSMDEIECILGHGIYSEDVEHFLLVYLLSNPSQISESILKEWSNSEMHSKRSLANYYRLNMTIRNEVTQGEQESSVSTIGDNDAPLIRTIEPPALVYKQCLGNVLVTATIPKDAQIRGTYHGKCRANKATIVGIDGSIRGVRIGISTYDCETMYRIGDEIRIDDFDMSHEECSTGFHFFCNKGDAIRYFD